MHVWFNKFMGKRQYMQKDIAYQPKHKKYPEVQ